MPPRLNFVGVNRVHVDAGATDNSELGPLQQLPGVWKSTGGRGWNVIALPFAGGPFNYRVLCNRYDETLTFDKVLKDVPNRGIHTNSAGVAVEADQTIAAVTYVQDIVQSKAADSPDSGMAGGANAAIHHEVGLWQSLGCPRTDGLNLARLSTIPHGDSVLALGSSSARNGPPAIPTISGLPIGITDVLGDPYLDPYDHFHQHLFDGLFDPTIPNELLKAVNTSNVLRTITLPVDSTVQSAGIVNIPFVVKQANAVTMRSTFWLQELDEPDPNRGGQNKLRLQYSQTIMLEFFPRNDGHPGLIQWPHVSINTLEKVSDQV